MGATWEGLLASGLVRPRVWLDTLTTYKLGGPARYLAVPADLAQLIEVGEAWQQDPLPVLILGRGSNVVVSETGFEGVVVHLTGRFLEQVIGDVTEAGGGVSLPFLARAAVRRGRLGLEFMVGIPGTVGGGVRQNAGCFGLEIVDVLEWVEVLTLGEERSLRVPAADLRLAYRSSNVTATQVVTRAAFRTNPGEPGEGEAKIREITRWRRLHQPGGTLNAGSVFKNPMGDAAGRIIDSLGLKGFRVGGAAVSERHANFFIAGPEATANDVYQLVYQVKKRVEEETGLSLEPEVQFVGDFEGNDEDRD